MKPIVSALIVAAGNGVRMQGLNKQFLCLGDKPVLAHTLTAFCNTDKVDEIIIAARESEILLVWDMIRDYGISKVKAVIPGGATRRESVQNGLKEVQGDFVLIHDGARPFVTESEICGVTEALQAYPAAAVGVAVTDTLKRVDENGVITETVPRENMVRIQTPQGFRTDLIRDLHKKAEEDGLSVTDDCILAERAGVSVRVIPGSGRNIKITTPEDIPVGMAILASREEDAPCV